MHGKSGVVYIENLVIFSAEIDRFGNKRRKSGLKSWCACAECEGSYCCQKKDCFDATTANFISVSEVARLKAELGQLDLSIR